MMSSPFKFEVIHTNSMSLNSWKLFGKSDDKKWWEFRRTLPNVESQDKLHMRLPTKCELNQLTIVSANVQKLLDESQANFTH